MLSGYKFRIFIWLCILIACVHNFATHYLNLSLQSDIISYFRFVAPTLSLFFLFTVVFEFCVADTAREREKELSRELETYLRNNARKDHKELLERNSKEYGDQKEKILSQK